MRPKGLPKSGGRKKGTPNKKAAIIRVFCDYAIDYGFEKFKTEFEKLEGMDYVKVYLGLAKIVTDDNTSLMANKSLIELYNKRIKRLIKSKQNENIKTS